VYQGRALVEYLSGFVPATRRGAFLSGNCPGRTTRAFVLFNKPPFFFRFGAINTPCVLVVAHDLLQRLFANYLYLWYYGTTIRYKSPQNRRIDVTYTVDDPELVEKLQVDKEGRLYLGKDLANTDVRVSVEVLERHGENE